MLLRAFLAFVLFATAAHAGSSTVTKTPAPMTMRPCVPMDKTKDIMAMQYDEVLVVAGLSEDGRTLMSVFASPKTGSWSLVATLADSKLSCVIDRGGEFVTRFSGTKA